MKTHLRPSLQLSCYIMTHSSGPIPPLEIPFHRQCPVFTRELTRNIPRMSRNTGKYPKAELRLNLTRGEPSRSAGREHSSPKRSSTSSSSPPSSCVSSESEQKEGDSPEAKSMVLAGCPRCLIYVMLSEEDPKCPKCKNTVLLDFHDGNRKR